MNETRRSKKSESKLRRLYVRVQVVAPALLIVGLAAYAHHISLDCVEA